MISFKKAVTSSVGRKYVMAISGLALVGFIITHLLGNLLLLSPNADLFNAYAEKLASFGNLLYVAEVGLAAFFILHIITAIQVTLGNKAAKGKTYKASTPSKGSNKNNFSSRTMIFTGLVLMIFLVLHVVQFKLGPSVSSGYASTLDGKEVRDLHRLVIETFRQPIYVLLYASVMVLLGFHLRHGFWSAFQSLGAINPRYSGIIQGLGVVIAILLSVGFLILPIWIYFDVLGVYK